MCYRILQVKHCALQDTTSKTFSLLHTQQCTDLYTPVSPWVGVVLLPVFQHGLHALDEFLEVLLHLPLVLKLLLRDERLVLDEGILAELAELLEADL